MEIHHIVPRSEGGDDSEENSIPLCLDCHADVMAYNPKHPKGRGSLPRNCGSINCNGLPFAGGPLVYFELGETVLMEEQE